MDGGRIRLVNRRRSPSALIRRSFKCAATSVSSAATSIRRALSRAISPSKDRPSTSSCADSLPRPSAWMAPPSRRLRSSGGRSGGTIRRWRHGLHDPQLPVISRKDEGAGCGRPVPRSASADVARGAKCSPLRPAECASPCSGAARSAQRVLAVVLDPASSARWFDGWKPARGTAPSAREHASADEDRPVARARTWLLRVGWRRHGLLDPAEVPG